MFRNLLESFHQRFWFISLNTFQMPGLQTKNLKSHGSHPFGDTEWLPHFWTQELCLPLLRHASLASYQKPEDKNMWCHMMSKNVSVCLMIIENKKPTNPRTLVSFFIHWTRFIECLFSTRSKARLSIALSLLQIQAEFPGELSLVGIRWKLQASEFSIL